MIEPTSSPTSTPAPGKEFIISTGNAIVDNFLAQEGDNARELSRWSEIEELFQKWWEKYMAYSYEEGEQGRANKDYQKALRILRNELGTLSEVKGGCMMLPVRLVVDSFRRLIMNHSR